MYEPLLIISLGSLRESARWDAGVESNARMRRRSSRAPRRAQSAKQVRFTAKRAQTLAGSGWFRQWPRARAWGPAQLGRGRDLADRREGSIEGLGRNRGADVAADAAQALVTDAQNSTSSAARRLPSRSSGAPPSPARKGHSASHPGQQPPRARAARRTRGSRGPRTAARTRPIALGARSRTPRMQLVTAGDPPSVRNSFGRPGNRRSSRAAAAAVGTRTHCQR
jgi:hypothetical protein